MAKPLPGASEKSAAIAEIRRILTPAEIREYLDHLEPYKVACAPIAKSRLRSRP
jgi:hypothetical protein